MITNSTESSISQYKRDRLAYTIAMMEPDSDTEWKGAWALITERVADVICTDKTRGDFIRKARFDYWKTHTPPKEKRAC